MRKLVTAVGFILLIFGCSVPLPSSLPTPFASPISIRTLAPSPTVLRVTSSTTPTVTALPLPNVQATLVADEAKELVFGLLKNNGNCELPCMWGLTPSKTTLTELDNFMGNFGNTFTLSSYVKRRQTDQTGGVTLLYRENGVNIKLYFTYYLNDKLDRIDQFSLLADSLFEKGIDPNWLSSTEISVLFGDPAFLRALEYYTLPKLLTTYGTPSQILIGAFPDEPDERPGMFHAFSLVLLYPERGIFAEYVSPRNIDGDYFVGCPAQSYINVAVWSPKSQPSLESIVNRHGGEINESNMEYFKTADEAIGLTPSKFYEIFKDSSNTDCLKTPATEWFDVFSQP